MKDITINHPIGDFTASRKYSSSYQVPGIITELEPFYNGFSNFGAKNYIYSTDPIDIELALDRNHFIAEIDTTTMKFAQSVFAGARIDFSGAVFKPDYGVECYIGYTYMNNTMHINMSNLGYINEAGNTFFEAVSDILPLYNIAWQLEHKKNIKIKFVTQENTKFCTDAKLTDLKVGEMNLNNDGTILYVLIPDNSKDTFALIRDKTFLNKFYDIDFYEKF